MFKIDVNMQEMGVDSHYIDVGELEVPLFLIIFAKWKYAVVPSS